MLTPPSAALCCQAAPFVLEFDPEGRARLELGRTWSGLRVAAVAGQSRGRREGQRVDRGGGPGADASRSAAVARDDPTAAGREAAAAPCRRGTHATRARRRSRAQVLARRQVPPADRRAGQDGRPRQPDDAESSVRGRLRRRGERSVRRRHRQSPHCRLRCGQGPVQASLVRVRREGRRPLRRRRMRRTIRRRSRSATSPASRSREMGMVYVCDRSSNRIQVFRKDGTFVKEGIVSKNTLGATVTRPVRRRLVAGIGVGPRLLERRRSSATCSSPTVTTRRCTSCSATRWRRSARSAAAAAIRDSSSRSAASRSTRRATCIPVSSITASACRSS